MDEQQSEANARFGRELSRLRRLHRFTQARLSSTVGVSQGHIGNIERGERTPDLRLVADLDRVLDAGGRLEKLWGQLTGDGEPVWLDDLADIERDAVSIMASCDTVFPSLLQTETYARAAVTTFSPWLSQEEVKASVKARMARAQRFTTSATMYRAVIDVSVLNRRPGNDAAAMAEQLARVVELAEDGRISIQLVDIGWHPGLVGTYTLLSPRAAPEVLYVESAHSGRVIDDIQAVQRFRVLLSDTQAVALSPEESLRLVREELEGLIHG